MLSNLQTKIMKCFSAQAEQQLTAHIPTASTE